MLYYKTRADSGHTTALFPRTWNHFRWYSPYLSVISSGPRRSAAHSATSRQGATQRAALLLAEDPRQGLPAHRGREVPLLSLQIENSPNKTTGSPKASLPTRRRPHRTFTPSPRSESTPHHRQPSHAGGLQTLLPGPSALLAIPACLRLQRALVVRVRVRGALEQAAARGAGSAQAHLRVRQTGR